MRPKARKKVARRTQKPDSRAVSPKKLMHLDKNGEPSRIPPFWSYGSADATTPRFTPPDGTPYWTVGTNIGGIPAPEDLAEAVRAHGGETWSWIFELIEFEPWRFFDHFPLEAGDRYAMRGLTATATDRASHECADLGDPASWKKDDRGFWQDFIDFTYAELMILHAAVNTAMAQGFFLALVRYADDLKNVPEAVAMLEKRREIARSNGKARSKKAEPKHKAIRARFRELRKTIPKKTARYLKVGNEFGMSDRQVFRIVDGID